MLIERQARAQERRVVPETIARFLSEAAVYAQLNVRPVDGISHTFDLPNATPGVLRRYERDSSWHYGPVASRYPRCSTDREIKLQEPAVLGNLTPGAPTVPLPAVAYTPAPQDWLHENVLQPFLEEVREERVAELDRVAAHTQLSLTERLGKADESIGRFSDALESRRRGRERTARRG
jgi:hypothetical protein